ncbi:SseB protein N-terminal domain-containing protein [Pseudobutyrivibrio sp. YE44]|uniref:SseB family protein n=1 Tax=Pseudobutyrivibrio sp. YE44 TaxID=1520802 RepID=UPI000889CC52|nr:SseB family protein [Pseudobutyrivibrio sp. YE44]SDB47779.1 SseB protein N-terminal domain-containing protein [Pseudobutyrivibrio sp. YE44]
MGLFDKKKTEENIAVEDTDVTSTVDAGRRFHVLIEGVTSMLDGNGSIVTGQLFGKIAKGDKVYVCMAATQPIQCEVQAIEATVDGRSTIVNEAEDTAVSLQLTLPDDANVKKYAIVTNIAPQEKLDPKVSVENPALAGIINGLQVHAEDNVFHAAVAYWVSHARFITPIKMDIAPEVNEQGVAVIKKDTKIGFYMLKSTVKLAGTPEGSESMVLPLFTDWTSLRNWEGLAKNGERIHTQVLTFQDVYAMLKRGGAYAGIAINPFNKIPCTLPVPYLDTITGTPGYQAEFGPKNPAPEGQANVQEQKIKAGQKILLGVPKVCEENDAIRQKLVEYGQSHQEIHSISFLTKIEEETKVVRHLVVLEFPQDYAKDDMKGHMEAIYQELNPLAHEITQIEYAIKGSIPAIDDVVNQHQEQMLIYTK